MPTTERVARVRDKLVDPMAILVVVRHDHVVVAMGLAEMFLEDGGTGAIRPDWCHVSMVFVHPDVQGRGFGRQVVAGIINAHPAHTLSLWTRVSNTSAIKLYRHHGFDRTDEVAALVDGGAVRRWQRSPDR